MSQPAPRSPGSEGDQPAHAPRCSFDPTDPQLIHRDQEIYAAARSAGPAAWSASHGGHWVVTGHELCRAVAADPDGFSSARGVHVPPSGLYEQGVRIYSLEYDQPDHRRHRQVLRQAVGERPARVPAELIRGHVRRLLGGLKWAAPVDLMNDFANPLPLEVIFDVIGADPEFKPEMKALVDALLFRRRSIPGCTDPAGRVIEIARLMAEQRRREPRDDWISAVAGSGDDDSAAEATSAIVAMITGGHHSTSRALGSLLARTVTEPGLQELLRSDPAAIPAAIDETVRLHTPLPSFSRTATADAQLGDVTVRAGEPVLLVYAAANRDPALYDRPQEFMLSRDHRHSLAFGYGPHRCVGIHLATAELRIALEELLQRTTWLELTEPIAWRGPAEPDQLLIAATL
jgi:cytochrome P450